jgi:hypothetical protein
MYCLILVSFSVSKTSLLTVSTIIDVSVSTPVELHILSFQFHLRHIPAPPPALQTTFPSFTSSEIVSFSFSVSKCRGPYRLSLPSMSAFVTSPPPSFTFFVDFSKTFNFYAVFLATLLVSLIPPLVFVVSTSTCTSTGN